MKNHYMKMRIIIVLISLVSFTVANAQSLLVEDFDYPVGTLLTNVGWVAHSGAGTQPIDVTNGLSFSGYLSSGIGGAANLDNNGEDIHRTFTAQTSGTVYAAFIIQTESTNSAGYFLHFGQSTLGTTFFTRLWVNANGSGVGIGTNAPATYVPITAGTPTLIVVKLEISTKISSLYVFNSFPASEPGSADATFTETATFSNVGSIALRQYNAAQRIIVDGIRVATNWADAVAPSGGNPIVALPTFNPTAGNYISAQNVEISTTTPGATIYYTTDGSEPTSASTPYSTSIPVNITTTIKARAYATGFDPSAVATAIYKFPVEVPDIATLRGGATDGTMYKLNGEAILTFQQSTRNQKYIQDATAAVLIDDVGGIISTTYNLYDGITGIYGTLTTYNGLLQFVPVFNTAPASSTGNVVVPEERTLSSLTSADQAKLIKVINAEIDYSSGNFLATAQNINVTQGTTTLILRTFPGTDYSLTPIPTVPQNITCLVGQFNTSMQISPRFLADFENVSSPSITVNPDVLTDFNYVLGSGPSAEQSFSISGINLTDNITITAPVNFEISETSGSGFTNSIILTHTSGIVSATSIYVRLIAGLAVNIYDETITATSTGAMSKTVQCSGEVTLPQPPDAPVATAAADVTGNSFTANWNAVSNATGYYLDVYYLVPGGTASDLFFSEYIEGSSNNKALEIFNGTGSSVDLSDYIVNLYSNGASTPGNTLQLTGTLANGDVYVIANASANATILGLADTTSNVTFFNGNDALSLYKASTTTVVDIFGVIGDNPGTAWTGAGGYSTLDKTLIRKPLITSGVTVNPVGTGPEAFTTLTTEWNIYPVDYIANLGVHFFGTNSFLTGYQNLSVGNVTSYSVTGLDPSTTYFYVVRAENANGTSSNSNEITVTTSGTTPTIIVSIPTLTGFSYYENSGPSAEQSFIVSGTNLTENITITPPQNYEISKTSGTGFVQYPATVTLTENLGIVGDSTIYVRLKAGLSVGDYNNENIEISSTGAVTKIITCNGSVLQIPLPEPTNHVSNFTAIANSHNQITVTWNDASAGQLPSGYLVKAETDPSQPVAPGDGVPETDAALVKNVLFGIEQVVFTGLNATTTYNFSIWPYTNSGSNIDYKTDGLVPVTSATTEDMPPPPAAIVLARPAYVDISAPTSEGAVLMRLENYPSDSARYRLYSGSFQYNCWREDSVKYITSNTYAVGPLAPGIPSDYTTFWIMYQRGGNISTNASYRDRLAPAYSTNFQTTILPAATEITTPFSLTGTFTGSGIYDNSVKHVVLAYSGSTLISAASTTLNTGVFALVCPDGVTVDKIEVRAVDNTLIDYITGSWAITTDVGDIPFVPITKTLELTLYLEGLYAGSGMMNQAQGLTGAEYGSGIADKITVELYDAVNTTIVHYSNSNVSLNTDGTVVIDDIPSSLDADYYIVIKHRNSIETWSATAVPFTGAGPISYSFASAASQAYGGNQKQVTGGFYAFYSGDINQDGIVDGSDMSMVENGSNQFLQGYNPEDANGDGLVDGSDMSVVENNSNNFIQIQKP
jgi:hypothetical protein